MLPSSSSLDATLISLQRAIYKNHNFEEAGEYLNDLKGHTLNEIQEVEVAKQLLYTAKEFFYDAVKKQPLGKEQLNKISRSATNFILRCEQENIIEKVIKFSTKEVQHYYQASLFWKWGTTLLYGPDQIPSFLNQLSTQLSLKLLFNTSKNLLKEQVTKEGFENFCTSKIVHPLSLPRESPPFSLKLRFEIDPK